MSRFVLKVKTKTGEQIVQGLTTESTISELRNMLFNISDIPVDRLHILHGFPPKSLDLSADNSLLCDTGLCPGDILILEEKPVTVKTSSSNNIAQQSRHHTWNDKLDCPGILMKQVVPADNSCLFTSIHFALNGRVDSSGEMAQWMRQLIAETISNDVEKFSEAMLGKSNKDYCRWIQDDKSWGGAIELAILANYFGIEMDVVDTINGIINRFGEDQRYAHRILLLFDGIHYDPLYLEAFEGGQFQTIFPSKEDRILHEAEQLAKEAKSSRQFTDVNKFTLKCFVCNIDMKGQIEAQQHAQSTGHMNFGEV